MKARLIAKLLLTDVGSYEPELLNFIESGLLQDTTKMRGWSAWFLGATGAELEYPETFVPTKQHVSGILSPYISVDALEISDSYYMNDNYVYLINVYAPKSENILTSIPLTPLTADLFAELLPIYYAK